MRELNGFRFHGMRLTIEITGWHRLDAARAILVDINGYGFAHWHAGVATWYV